MTDSLLRSLRDHMMDEAEPLAGLLRKCLLLGAETGSVSLRQWARKELHGYEDADELPGYRKLPTPPISADTLSGNTWASNMTYSVLQLPSAAREYFRDGFFLYQPIEELEKIAAQKSASFTGPGLAYAQHAWNKGLPFGQQVVNLRFTLSGSTFAGVLGQIRTQLVDLVADLTAGTPLEELPRKELVDAAVGTHIGTQYNTTIQTMNGATAIGDQARAKSEGLSVDDAIRLLDAVRTASGDVSDADAKSELLKAIEDLRGELQADSPETSAVVTKAGRLKEIAAKIGGAGVSAAASGVIEAVTALVMSGAFG
ncbi:hypothetical protein QWJ90_00220 [Microbacterium oryzae]|uniref:AbiTii domain-containing protein n=1 Tax=Microbacterium oryzae TaxID=743009 RepID=UPI0025AF0FD8|nr:hypothetical protein [Microbacterium oryzae]MDN3309352.1 hypothetical protein [Microbacterium oryzae]